MYAFHVLVGSRIQVNHSFYLDSTYLDLPTSFSVCWLDHTLRTRNSRYENHDMLFWSPTAPYPITLIQSSIFLTCVQSCDLSLPERTKLSGRLVCQSGGHSFKCFICCTSISKHADITNAIADHTANFMSCVFFCLSVPLMFGKRVDGESYHFLFYFYSSILPHRLHLSCVCSLNNPNIQVKVLVNFLKS